MRGDGWIRRRRTKAAAAASVGGDGKINKSCGIWKKRKVALQVETRAVSRQEVAAWCRADQLASEALKANDAAAFSSSHHRSPPLLAQPPLGRVPLRPGHVVEIFGPSGSGKTEILIQATVLCILPVKLGGISYGGSQGVAVLFDLDGRFDLTRFMAVLHAHIDGAHGKASASMNEAVSWAEQKKLVTEASLKRFYRLRCSTNFEFLCALKTFSDQSSRLGQEHLGSSELQLVLIDGIGAFYWLDWVASCAAPLAVRKTLGVQRLSELIVRELRRLRGSKLFLVLATKSPLYGPSKKAFWDGKTERAKPSRIEYRESMPAAWKNFVTHRLLLQAPPLSASGPRIFTAQWDKPLLTQQEHFLVEATGILSMPTDPHS